MTCSPSQVQRPLDHGEQVGDVERVEVRARAAAEGDGPAVADAADESRYQPPGLAGAVGREQPENDRVEVGAVRAHEPFRRQLCRPIVVVGLWRVVLPPRHG